MDSYGNNYETQGTSSKNVNNGHMRVTELEVYAVKDCRRKFPDLPTPLRKTAEWGPKFTSYDFGDRASLQLYDTRGIAESDTLDLLQCNFILDGRVPDFHEVTSTSLISNDDASFRQSPTLSNKIHCVVFVFDGSTVDDISTPMLQKLVSYQDLLNRKEIPQAVLVTNIDKLCENISKTFKSLTVKEVVDKVSLMVKLPRNTILPIKNHEEEMESDEKVNILALLAVRGR